MNCKLFNSRKSGHSAKSVLCATAAVMTVCSGVLAVSADNAPASPSANQSENYVPDLDTAEARSLTINFGKDSDDGGRTGFQGAEFSIYKAADLAVKNGGAVYTLTSPYKDLAVYNKDDGGVEHTFDGLSADESNTLAKKLADRAKNPIASAVTNADGNASFQIKEDGMYLVVETGKSGDATEYETVDPFLVSVPEINPETKQWIYAVEAKPKTELKAVPKKPAEPEKHTKAHVNTSVENKVKPYIISAAIAGTICLIIGIYLVDTKKRRLD